MQHIITQFEPLMAGFILVLCRVSALIISMPIIGTKLVQKKIKIILSIILSLLIVGKLPRLELELMSLGHLLSIIKQLSIGLALGFAIQVVFQLFAMMGEMISMQMGLGFAVMVEPFNSNNHTVLSQFFLCLSSLIFLSFDGHLLIIETLGKSFYFLPLAASKLGVPWLDICQLLGLVLGTAFKMAMPIGLNLLIITVALGVMNKSVPQLNIFTIGMSMSVFVGIVLIAICFNSYSSQLRTYFESMFDIIVPWFAHV